MSCLSFVRQDEKARPTKLENFSANCQPVGVMMRIVVGILGLLLMLATLWETFESIILPRRVTRRFRVTRLFYQVSWAVWSGVNLWLPSKKVRETHLSYFGPLSLLMLFATWAFALVVAFAMLHWAAG